MRWSGEWLSESGVFLRLLVNLLNTFLSTSSQSTNINDEFNSNRKFEEITNLR